MGSAVMSGVILRCKERFGFEDSDKIVTHNESSYWPSPITEIWLKYAQIALHSYEKKKGSKFLLVGLYPYSLQAIHIPEIDENGALWIHITFIVVPTGADREDSNSWIFIFAELIQYFGVADIEVACCTEFSPYDIETTFCCGICDPADKVPHPSSGYKMGLWDYADDEVPGCLYSKRSRQKTSYYAELALKLHKTGEDLQDDTQYELVKGLDHSGRVTFVSTTVHVSFEAKPKNAEESQLFFAELQRTQSAENFTLLKCCILNNGDPGISYGCGFCKPGRRIAHPPDYVVGHWTYRHPRELRG